MFRYIVEVMCLGMPKCPSVWNRGIISFCFNSSSTYSAFYLAMMNALLLFNYVSSGTKGSCMGIHTVNNRSITEDNNVSTEKLIISFNPLYCKTSVG
jgi:hypothetical protein